MKISRWFAILAFVGAILAFGGLSSSTALASSIPPDPGVKLICPPCTTTILFEPTFSFDVAVGDNVYSFINESGVNAVELDLTSETPGLIFTCLDGDSGDAYFTTCTPEPNGIKFSGLNSDHGGIPSCSGEACSSAMADFGIEVSTTEAFRFDGILAAPEPSTVLLLAVGLLFLFLLRRAGWVPKLT